MQPYEAACQENLQLRPDDSRLDGQLDRLGTGREVRTAVEDFSARVRAARYQPLGGSPLTTNATSSPVRRHPRWLTRSPCDRLETSTR